MADASKAQEAARWVTDSSLAKGGNWQSGLLLCGAPPMTL